MKMAKVLSLIMAFALCLGLFTGCGANNYTAKNTEYVIGLSGPLTGGAAVYGVAVQNSAQMAVDEINAAGGLN
ncbi:MAG: amino acid ABC transporter substrate-binding protein, partial [Oscillospiraceae bacterium]|nr:amino acid ABC transporter substrate-binding protein [Oscillospiraceae bacterium]